MKNNFFKYLKKVVCFVFVGIICSQLHTTNVFAAQADWRLLFNPALLPAENLKSWESQGITTLSQTKLRVERVGGGAQIWARTTNNLNGLYTSAATTKVDTAKGKEIIMRVSYYISGTSYNTPYGYFEY